MRLRGNAVKYRSGPRNCKKEDPVKSPLLFINIFLNGFIEWEGDRGSAFKSGDLPEYCFKNLRVKRYMNFYN